MVPSAPDFGIGEARGPSLTPIGIRIASCGHVPAEAGHYHCSLPHPHPRRGFPVSVAGHLP